MLVRTSTENCLGRAEHPCEMIAAVCCASALATSEMLPGWTSQHQRRLSARNHLESSGHRNASAKTSAHSISEQYL
jgi:hypothetical protein